MNEKRSNNLSSNYINGNYFVNLDYTGTKVKRALRVGEELSPRFPDSIDLKITNKCLNNCPFCHESSNPSGKSFDFNRTVAILDQLPHVGIEIAIGGGNIFEIPEDTIKLIEWCESRNFQPRVTVRYSDIQSQVEILPENEDSPYHGQVKYKSDKIKKLLDISHNVGISLDNYIEDPITEFLGNDSMYYLRRRNQSKCVYHIIAGLFPLEDLKKLLKSRYYDKILILGFKQFGRARTMNLPEKSLEEWSSYLKQYLYRSRYLFDGKFKKIVGFDNLAIDQLGIQDCLTKDEWNKLYFGDEFSSSMYIDAVEEKYAPTSRDLNRVSWSKMNIIDYFNKYKNGYEDKANN